MADNTFKRERNRQAAASSGPGVDPSMTRRALLIVVAGAVLGGAIILLTDGYRSQLTDWAQDDPARALNLLLPAMAITIVLPVLGIAWYFWRLGASTVREQRFPPTHVTWANAAPPVHGAAARRRGRFLQWCAAALLVIIVVFSAVLVQLVMNLRAALDGRAPV